MENFITPELREWARSRDGEEAHPLRCITCGGRFTRIFAAPPRDEAEAKQRQDGLTNEQIGVGEITSTKTN